MSNVQVIMELKLMSNVQTNTTPWKSSYYVVRLLYIILYLAVYLCI